MTVQVCLDDKSLINVHLHKKTHSKKNALATQNNSGIQ